MCTNLVRQNSSEVYRSALFCKIQKQAKPGKNSCVGSKLKPKSKKYMWRSFDNLKCFAIYGGIRNTSEASRGNEDSKFGRIKKSAGVTEKKPTESRKMETKTVDKIERNWNLRAELDETSKIRGASFRHHRRKQHNGQVIFLSIISKRNQLILR